MRQRRNKRVRKAVSFYKVCYQFREPFKVLLDGNFLHACQQLKFGSPEEIISKLLGSQVRVFVTKCVQHELRSMGAEFTETAKLAKQLPGIAGSLEPPASAADSIRAAVGKTNAEHFFVGTQDPKLREDLQKISGLPLLFVHATGIGLELPSETMRKQAELDTAVPAHERHTLGIEPGAGMQVHTNVRFKRNVAKAPNPLSCKPKKQKEAGAAGKKRKGGDSVGGDDGGEEGEGERQRKKTRKRRRGAKAGGDGGQGSEGAAAGAGGGGGQRGGGGGESD